MPFLAALLLALAHALAGPGVSYQDLTAPKDEKAFYAAHGERHSGRRVHLHVPAARLHAKPVGALHLRGTGRVLEFKNRSVPLLIAPGNVYARKARQRTSPGDTLCVKGTVTPHPLAPGRFALAVHKIQTHPSHGGGGGRKKE